MGWKGGLDFEVWVGAGTGSRVSVEGELESVGAARFQGIWLWEC